MFLVSMCPINFKANYIQPITIMKRENKSYVPYEAALVEFNPKDELDLNTIKDISLSWEENSFAGWIHQNAFKRLFYQSNNKDHIYGIVKPQESYEKVQTKNVLGLADFSEDDNLTELNYLQTHPDNLSSKYPISTPMTIWQIIKKSLCGSKFFSKKREYKNIGSAMLNFLKDVSDYRIMGVYADKNAIDFYKHNDFVSIDKNCPGHMFWRRENIVTD